MFYGLSECFCKVSKIFWMCNMNTLMSTVEWKHRVYGALRCPLQVVNMVFT